MVAVTLLVARSHNRTVPSSTAIAIDLPSLSKEMDHTAPEFALSIANGSTAGTAFVAAAVAVTAGVKRVVISHRMLRTLGKEAQTEAEIRKRYAGPLTFANDLDCFALP